MNENQDMPPVPTDHNEKQDEQQISEGISNWGSDGDALFNNKNIG